ncbi:unnamed protein product [Hyaloperonospora brassicae]|uniref:Uncharacterized protein n=1 Tax=Hyaloperonospora brassicae TaxID=162125 RepID=A0AAV0V0A6_HYABA|nr:unnamed protein product [Hyaloperonospora brassicae]
MPGAPLSTLSSALLPADAPDHDTDWPTISSGLAALRLRANAELTELTAALESLESPAGICTLGEHDDVLAICTDLKAVQPRLCAIEQHFLQLKSIIQPRVDTLETLQSRATYLKTAVQIEALSQQVEANAVHGTPEALADFQRFADLVAAVPLEFPALRRKALCRVDELSLSLRRFAMDKLKMALDMIKWPEPLATPDELKDKEAELRNVSNTFAFLLTLQVGQESTSPTTTDLWAMDCVLEPLLLRFRYHFERNESLTNQLAKPEWYLSHMQEQIGVHTRFLAQVLTPELHRYRTEIHCWDAQILMLRGLIRAASRKLAHDLPTLLTHPPLLCHTLDEVLLFEYAIDEDIGYGSWASTDRGAYPRCIDVFTSHNGVLFAWTNVDVEYAQRVLSLVFEAESSGSELELDACHGKQDSVWRLEEEVYRRANGTVSEHEETMLVPPVAHQFVALLDFLSQRFTLMEAEEHRYLYVMQVHLPLLHRFGQLCEARGCRLMSALTQKTTDANTLYIWGELFVVVNALQCVKHALAAWEQSNVFLELSRKVARSETTRAQVLRMHVAYSKQVFARATASVLATQEATAVRQALAGPGAMIGPTAAFSAAYSVGSKTMKSLFRRAEIDANVEEDDGQALRESEALSGGTAATAKIIASYDSPANELEEVQDETLLFSHTIFERQISQLTSVITMLLDGGKDILLHTAERDLEMYRASSFWNDTEGDGVNKDRLSSTQTVSSELACSYTLISNVLSCARKLLLPECRSILWESLASALDCALFDAFYNPVSTVEVTQLSSTGMRQFTEDIESLVAIFAAGSTKPLPRSYFRLTQAVCNLLNMPAARRRDVCKALDDASIAFGSESGDDFVQYSTILEACGIFSLSPAQVVWICASRLDYCRQERPRHGNQQ